MQKTSPPSDTDPTFNVDAQLRIAFRHLLSQVDRNPASPTSGCFDRRYWAWKLIDYPEATFQRNLLPLSWLLRPQNLGMRRALNLGSEELCKIVDSGLEYAATIQHGNGSFDQAFPNEQSYGATAFLLHPLVYSFRALESESFEFNKPRFLEMIARAAEFLATNGEKHGLITNHLAGACLSLYSASKLLGDPKIARPAENATRPNFALANPEGWFPEYDGADPGYQTLAVYYLALIHQDHEKKPELREALKKAFRFLSYFIYPDGSFAGEVGSRRTGVFYPGGYCLMAAKDGLARVSLATMADNIQSGKTTNLIDIDIGNLAPLLSN